MNKYSKIGLFDSGLGGLSVLSEIMKLLPNEDYLFYEDSINNPYGEKSEEELMNITSNITEYLLKNDCKIIVIACNTATTSCMTKLREKYKDVIFVGTVPAIKVACDNNYKNILVIATPCTILSNKTNQLIKRFKKDNQNVYLVSCTGLANAIETNNKKLIKELLDKYLTIYKDIDAIVLGCTHYIYIKDLIQKYYPDATILDGNLGVAKRVKYILEENNLLSDNKKGNIRFIKSK